MSSSDETVEFEHVELPEPEVVSEPEVFVPEPFVHPTGEGYIKPEKVKK